MKKRILYLLLAIAGFWQMSCKKNSGGMPTISGVRVVDSTKRDSLFKQAYPGTLIVINGSNLNDAQAVFFNDTSAFFNPVYNTSTHLIVSIPATAQTAATRSNVPNLLRVVTSHGTVSYTFTLVEPPPYITSISFDNSGTMVFINGGNFEGISKITFPGGDTALGYTVNKDLNQIAALIPAGSGLTDSLRVFVHYGVASYPFPPPMTIVNISNENAAAGDTLTFTGTNFVGIKSVLFPGGISVTSINSIDVSKFTVIVPAGITTADTLKITGTLGSVKTSQPFATYLTHPSPGYLCDFDVQYSSDNTGFVGWTGGYADAPTAATNYPGGNGGVGFLAQGSPMPPNTNAGSQGNGGFEQLNPVPWVANTGASVSDYSLKFEVYTKKPWSAGAIFIMMGDWYGWHNYMARYAPWSGTTTGVFNPSGWTTVTIPLTQFVTVSGTGTSAMTGGKVNSPNNDNNQWDLQTFPTGGVPASKFSDYSSTSLCFALVNDQGSPTIAANTLNIAIDNVRIVKGK